MKGERATIWFGVKAGLQLWLPLLGTQIIVGLATLLAAFAFIIPAFYVAARSILAEPVAVAERASGIPGLKRSFALTQSLFWRHLLILLIVIGFMFFIGARAAIPSAVAPTLDHWLLTVAMNIFVDLAMSWPAMLYVAAYWAAARPMAEEPLIQRSIEAGLSNEHAS